MFRALGDQLEGHQRNHFKHRCDVVDYMVEHRYAFEPFLEDGISFDRYTARLRKKGAHVGNDALVAFAKIHDLNVVIHQMDQPTLMISGAKVSKTAQQLHIAYHNGEHYSSVKRINVKTPAPKSQLGEPRRKIDIQEQHKGSHRKTTSSSGRSNHRDDVPKLNGVKETHHKLKKAGDKQTSGSIPREEYSLGHKVHKAVLRDEESFRQKTQKVTQMDESSLKQKRQKAAPRDEYYFGQKTPKAVLRDENSLNQNTQKEALIGHKDPPNLVNMKNKTSESDDGGDRMTLKEFLDYFNKQDMTVIDFMETKEFMDYCDSNNMTTLWLVNELRSDPRTREREEKRFMEREGTGRSNVRRQEEMTERSNIESGVLDSKKLIAQCKGKRDAQFNRTSSIPGRNSEVDEQKEKTWFNEDKAIADDGQTSVKSHKSSQVHKPEMDDEQLSVIKDVKVQVTESQLVLDTKAMYVKLKGKSSSSKVKDEYKVHQPEIRSKCLERSGMDLEVGYSLQGHSDKEHSSELPTEGSQGLSAVIQECHTTSTVLGMCDAQCSVGGAGKQMTKLDEESDLGYMCNRMTIYVSKFEILLCSKHLISRCHISLMFKLV